MVHNDVSQKSSFCEDWMSLDFNNLSAIFTFDSYQDNQHRALLQQLASIRWKLLVIQTKEFAYNSETKALLIAELRASTTDWLEVATHWEVCELHLFEQNHLSSNVRLQWLITPYINTLNGLTLTYRNASYAEEEAPERNNNINLNVVRQCANLRSITLQYGDAKETLQYLLNNPLLQDVTIEDYFSFTIHEKELELKFDMDQKLELWQCLQQCLDTIKIETLICTKPPLQGTLQQYFSAPMFAALIEIKLIAPQLYAYHEEITFLAQATIADLFTYCPSTVRHITLDMLILKPITVAVLEALQRLKHQLVTLCINRFIALQEVFYEVDDLQAFMQNNDVIEYLCVDGDVWDWEQRALHLRSFHAGTHRPSQILKVELRLDRMEILHLIRLLLCCNPMLRILYLRGVKCKDRTPIELRPVQVSQQLQHKVQASQQRQRQQQQMKHEAGNNWFVKQFRKWIIPASSNNRAVSNEPAANDVPHYYSELSSILAHFTNLQEFVMDHFRFERNPYYWKLELNAMSLTTAECVNILVSMMNYASCKRAGTLTLANVPAAALVHPSVLPIYSALERLNLIKLRHFEASCLLSIWPLCNSVHTLWLVGDYQLTSALFTMLRTSSTLRTIHLRNCFYEVAEIVNFVTRCNSIMECSVGRRSGNDDSPQQIKAILARRCCIVHKKDPILPHMSPCLTSASDELKQRLIELTHKHYYRAKETQRSHYYANGSHTAAIVVTFRGTQEDNYIESV